MLKPRALRSFVLRNWLVAWCWLFPVLAANAQYLDLLKRVPGEANAVMLIDASKLFASPLAQKQEWRQKRDADYAARPLSIPPQATQILRAASIDLQSRAAAWEIMLLKAEKFPALADIARRERGFVDNVANTKVVWSPRGAYALSLGQDTLGILFPPNRQFLSRWIKQPSGRIAPYLLAASESMKSTDAQIVLAIDLEDAILQSQAATWLANQEFTKQAAGNPTELAELLAGLRGIKFEVVVNDAAWGRLQLDFSADPALLAPVAQPLVSAALKRIGAELEDLSDWQVTKKEQSLSLHGKFSTGGILRLGSLFEMPAIDLESADNTELTMPQATLNHFKAVDQLLKNLLDQKQDTVTMGQLAVWIQQYAKRIDRLPLSNVDPAMQAFSAGVAEDLRAIATGVKTGNINEGIRTASVYDTYDGYYGYRNVDGERRSIRAEERGTAALNAVQLSDRIHAETARIRQEMTEKYKINF
ncbi:MAG: hypothetical protein SFX18_17120 [Pirellulales bacterium]|nr:hypothetical protein [Pirellulales bacterium]